VAEIFYIELFRAFEKEGLRYLLVGGLAVNLYGVERATMDVDIILAMEGENLDRFLRAARSLGLVPVMPVALESLADEAARSQWAQEKGMVAFALRTSDPAAPTLDVLIRPQVPFEEAWARRVEKTVAGLKICLASVDDLIRMKSATGRLRDRSDIEALEKARRLGVIDGKN
jgi:hypothetical protein